MPVMDNLPERASVGDSEGFEDGDEHQDFEYSRSSSSFHIHCIVSKKLVPFVNVMASSPCVVSGIMAETDLNDNE